MNENLDNVFIFTECFNCGHLLQPFLKSFFRHHDAEIHVVTSKSDISDAGSIINDPRVKIIDISDNKAFAKEWKDGHAGTAMSFAYSIRKWTDKKWFIHFDSDVIFKKECITGILNPLLEGYDIVGTPRAYKHNLSGSTGLDGLKDTVSTYAFGMNRNKIPEYEFSYFVRMCGGWANPLKHPILDFFDPVVFAAMNNGASIKYLDTKEYGGMTCEGSKYNGYVSNLNFDCGSRIIHFGGVGSGCAYYHGKSKPSQGYADWALGRWSLYSKLFFNTNIPCNFETKYSKPNDHEGRRWCSGNYDDSIINKTREDLEN